MKKDILYIGFSTACGFRHPLGVLKHILHGWGTTVYIPNCFSLGTLLSVSFSFSIVYFYNVCNLFSSEKIYTEW